MTMRIQVIFQTLSHIIILQDILKLHQQATELRLKYLRSNYFTYLSIILVVTLSRCKTFFNLKVSNKKNNMNDLLCLGAVKMLCLSGDVWYHTCPVYANSRACFKPRLVTPCKFTSSAPLSTIQRLNMA